LPDQIVAIMLSILGALPCAAEPFVVVPHDESTRVEIRTASPIGRIELWVPEAIMSERGVCAIYPAGVPWRCYKNGWDQSIAVRQSYGPGNYNLKGNEIECVGVRIPVSSPVSWTTRLVPGNDRLEFEIRLRNEGQALIRRAAAAVCVKFLDADWWSDESTFAISGANVVSLAQLGREVGADDRFEAYLVRDQEFPNPFYVKFWGFNRHQLDRALLVSVHRTAGCFAAVSAKAAYFMHSNKVNPCTDVMLALGNVEPGAVATARGVIAIKQGRADEYLLKRSPNSSTR
jgi:hypothetical protein